MENKYKIILFFLLRLLILTWSINLHCVFNNKLKKFNLFIKQNTLNERKCNGNNK